MKKKKDFKLFYIKKKCKIIPIKDSIWLLIKKGQDDFEEQEHYGFAFVPLIED